MATPDNLTAPADADEPAVRNLDDLECEGRRVLVRTSVWVLDRTIRRLARMRAGVPLEQLGPTTTLERLLADGARVIVATSLDAAGTSQDAAAVRQLGYEDMMALGEALAEALRVEVLMPDDCIGEAAEIVVQDLRPGQLCLLPDLASHPADAAGEERFAQGLERLCDVYVADGLDLVLGSSASIARLPLRVRDAALGHAALATLSALVAFAQAAPEERFAIVGDSGPLEDQLTRIESLLATVPRLLCLGQVGRALSGSPVGAETPARVRALKRRAETLGAQLLTAPSGAGQSVSPAELGEAIAQSVRGARAGLWWGTAGREADAQVLSALADGPATVVPLGTELHHRVEELEAPELAFRSCAETAVAFAMVAQRRLPGVDALMQAQLRQRASTPRGAPGVEGTGS